MGFQELDIKPEYRSFSDNVVIDFYIPVMNEATLYKRAVGFFSSTALIELSRGISGLIKNGGKILLIASPRLRDEDVEAINKGYEERDKVIERAIISSIFEPKNYFEEERLNLLANLIAENKLDIKIAFTETNNNIGIYHEKMGLLYDEEGNIIAFTGSMNETNTAFIYNYESIDVFCSWKNDIERVNTKEKAFNTMWNDYEPNITIKEFPNIAKEKLEKYKNRKVSYDEMHELDTQYVREKTGSNFYGPYIPEDIKLYDYQLEAIGEWAQQGYRGIFDMATGTGKTFTGLGAICKLYDHSNKRLAIIIVCPFQHLVEQWVDDIKKFNIKPIIGYSASAQRDWKNRLKNAIFSFNLGIKDHFCLVTTNATFSSKFVQSQIEKLDGNIVLVVDEAHNFGASNLSKTLNPKIPYRLALSATLDRHGDEEGTNKLYNYFGEKCIEYTLERAIKENKLVHYYYYPKIIYLTDEELSEYIFLSKQITKHCKKDKRGKLTVSDAGKMLLIKRARIIAAAQAKIKKLHELMENNKHEKHVLVYCGAASVRDPDYEEKKIDDFEVRQIDVVSDLLGNKLGMRISKFTSEESKEERERLKAEFADGDHIQALVAIRCLDEGVNIPKIKTAYILASSTNPKEYIQRRGRVLRKAKGKSYAVLYDFITLPRPLDIVQNLSPEEIKFDYPLVKRELSRMGDFASIANNPSETDFLIEKIKQSYGFYDIGGEEHVI